MFLFDKMKSDTYNTLGIYPILNSPFGLWPLGKNNFLVKTCWFVSTFELALMVMSCLHELYFTCDYADFSVDILVIISFGLIGLAKLIFYYMNRENLRTNIESAIEDWSSKETTVIDSITRRYKRCYQRVIRIYLALGLSASLMYPFKIFYFDRDSFVKMMIHDKHQQAEQVVTMVKKRFLFPSVCSFNDASTTVYSLITLNQLFQFAICVGVNLAADSFFITITYHLCGQFAILKQRFASFEKMDNETKTKYEFGCLVARHKHLLMLTKSIEKSLNIIIFTQVVVNLILFNVTGINFLIYLKKKDQYSAITHFGMISFTLTQTFMYACIGENVSSTIETITQSIYEGNWQTLPKTMAKDVIFLMTLSNTTIHLTGGKLFRMKKSTFTQVVKTSISYLSVFNALVNNH